MAQGVGTILAVLGLVGTALGVALAVYGVLCAYEKAQAFIETRARFKQVADYPLGHRTYGDAPALPGDFKVLHAPETDA